MKNFIPSFVRIIFLVLSLVSVIGITAQTSNLPALTPKQVAQRTLPSIVILIMNNGDSLPVTTGSGFFVAEDTIITNYHVVKNARLGAFRIYGSDEVYSVIGTLGIDSVNDLALLKVKGVKGKPLKLNGSNQLSIGDEVFTASSPKGLEGSFSQGLISGLRKTSKEDLIQITAPISHGSSGGAILNNQAEVIAVAVGGIDEGQSLNFAVPIKYAQTLMAKRASLADLPGKTNNSYGNSPKLSGEVSTGGGQNANPITSIGSGLGSSVKSPTAIISESVIKAPRAILEIIKSRIPPSVLKPNQFKVPDLVEENLRSDVFSTLTTSYEAISNFDKFTKGKQQSQYTEFYNRDGNLTEKDFVVKMDKNEKTYVHSGVEYRNGLRVPIQSKSYNSVNRAVTVENYYLGKFITQETTAYSSKEINTYNSKGEQIASDQYDEKGKLDYKDMFEYSNLFSKNISCSSENECEFTYSGLDSDGNETIIRYDGKNLNLMRKVERSGFVRDDVSYSFCHPKEEYNCNYDGKISKITTTTSSYDSQTNQIIGKTIQIRDLDNPNKSVGKESYKYEYKYDSKGNWIEKIEKKEVTKFGETYFEPISFIEREIRYYSDEDAKPSVNKKSTVKR